MNNWFTSLLKKSDFHIEWIPLSKSFFWSYKNGKISHKSGRFFKIIGIRFYNSKGDLTDQPFIDQREIGTLGFLIRDSKQEKEILVQAKIEPGNSHIVQLAPTCQATKSNSLMVHGGKEPPFSHMFIKEHLQIISSTLQSEQGSRFFKKRNRNISATNSQKFYLPDSHRWISINKLLSLLSEDFLVNTDARSVLACSPWNKLINRTPFSRLKTNFVSELAKSYKQSIKRHQFKNIEKDILLAQQKKHPTQSIPLEKLNDWKITDIGIVPDNKKSYKVRYLKVTTKNREVPEWDQPIIDSYEEGLVNLVCGRIDGVLHFYFSIITEPGLYNHTELSPTIGNFSNYPKAKIIKSVLQSDEGGRFYQDTTRYQVVDIGEADLTLPGYWLNLAQIQDLLLKNGWFTNEARSAISLLLYWL
ncbi:MAG: dTDP-4-keto-6-deoxy-L-hexose2,3-dehydratase [uncultured bacterium]|nr:MAG: dTDP-4-keto-6-deoxy-L-hexose2,3-dehydratase [uncultured bacterium]